MAQCLPFTGTYITPLPQPAVTLTISQRHWTVQLDNSAQAVTKQYPLRPSACNVLQQRFTVTIFW